MVKKILKISGIVIGSFFALMFVITVIGFLVSDDKKAEQEKPAVVSEAPKPAVMSEPAKAIEQPKTTEAESKAFYDVLILKDTDPNNAMPLSMLANNKKAKEFC